MKHLVTSLLLWILSAPSVAQTVAVVGGKVHTVGPQGTVEEATVLVVDGKIAAVGAGVRVPSGATIIDAAGKIVTPGLFSPIGRLGLVEVGLSAGPVDSEQRGTEFTAGFDVADAYNRRSTLIAINRIEGITRAAITPSPGAPDETGTPGHVLSGMAAIVNLGDRDVLDRRRVAMVVTLGQVGSLLAGGTRSGAWLVLRNALEEAVDYRDHKGDFVRGLRREYRHSVADLEALQPVIAGQVPILVGINRAADIEVLLDLVEEFELEAVIAGGAEAWMVADEIANAGVAVILAPASNLPSSFDTINARRGAASILVDAGVKVALADSQSQTHNARNITQSAGNAVRDGLSWDAALRAITLTPAEIYGVSDAVGSIEVGKAADLVVWPADPLELTTFPEQVLIDGTKIPMVSRQILLRDRYLDNDMTKPPAYRD